MLASSVQAVVACNATAPRVCTLVLFIVLCGCVCLSLCLVSCEFTCNVSYTLRYTFAYVLRTRYLMGTKIICMIVRAREGLALV